MSLITCLQTKLLAEEGQCGDDIDTGSIQWSEDENKERGNWQGRYDFLMSGERECAVATHAAALKLCV